MTDSPFFTIRSAEKSRAMAVDTELPTTIGINQNITHPTVGKPSNFMSRFYKIALDGFKPSFVAQQAAEELG